MDSVAQLIGAIGGLIGVISGAFVSIYAVVRGSSRERQAAAQVAIERVLEPDDDDDDRREAVEDLLTEILKRWDDDRGH